MGWDANLVRFGRQQLQAQWCAALGGGTVFSLTGGLGLTLPLGPRLAQQPDLHQRQVCSHAIALAPDQRRSRACLKMRQTTPVLPIARCMLAGADKKPCQAHLL